MAKGYTDKITIENYLLQTINSSFDSQLTAWIEAVEAIIDNITGRNFVGDAEDAETTRTYDGNGRQQMVVDDFVSIESITIDDVLVTTDDWYLYPANTSPKKQIVLKTEIFSTGQQNVVISARWGYGGTVPADIKLAATILVAGILNYSNNAKGKVRSETIGRYSVTYADDKGFQDFARANEIIMGHKKYSF